MKIANMGGSTLVCAFLFVVLVNFQPSASKPFFGSMFCDMFCEEYDDGLPATSTTADGWDDLMDAFFDPCSGCPDSTPVTPSTTMSPGMTQPFNIMIPPANGMNLTMQNTGTTWLMNFTPWGGSGASSATPAPAAAAAATTPAAAAATTPAGGNATTAAATTAKAA